MVIVNGRETFQVALNTPGRRGEIGFQTKSYSTRPSHIRDDSNVMRPPGVTTPEQGED